jgi:hypothetical protein
VEGADSEGASIADLATVPENQGKTNVCTQAHCLKAPKAGAVLRDGAAEAEGRLMGELVDPPRQCGLARDGGVEALLNDAIAKTRNSAVWRAWCERASV